MEAQRMLLRLATALKSAWATVEQFGEAIDRSPYEEAQLNDYCLEGRIAELERRLGCEASKSSGP